MTKFQAALALSIALAPALALAQQPIPSFHSGSGKRYNMEVGADKINPSRLRIWMSEWGNGEGTFTRQMAKAGFAVKESDTVEFLIPASACQFRDRFLINCDSDKLSATEREQIELSFHSSGSSEGAILRVTGRELAENSLGVNISTQIDETTVVNEKGELHKSRSLGFTSRVWMYESMEVNGHFHHKVRGMRMN